MPPNDPLGYRRDVTNRRRRRRGVPAFDRGEFPGRAVGLRRRGVLPALPNMPGVSRPASIIGGAPGPQGIRPPIVPPPPRGIPPGGDPGPVQHPRVPPNPNQFLSASYEGSRTPLEHKRWWEAHGWDWQNGRFVRSGAPGGQPAPVGGWPGPVGPPGGGPGGSPGGIPGGASGPNQPPGAGGLPLDPYFEAGRRSLDDMLAAQLAGLAPAREQIMAQQGLSEARLGTNEGNDIERLMSQMAARGILNSGIQRENRADLGTDYLRSRQDLTNMTAAQLAQLTGAEGDYRGDFQRQLMELLLQSAARNAQDPYAPIDTGTSPGAVGGGGRRRRRGGGGGGGRRRRR